MPAVIRPYQDSDFNGLYALWNATLGVNWPLSPEFARRMLVDYPNRQADDLRVAEVDGQVAGFSAAKIDISGKSGGIALLMVHPDRQRQGIGTLLHAAAMDRLRGIDSIQLAHGGGETLWPGVPLNSPGAVEFFKAQGWHFPDTAYDLTRDLIDYQTPPGVLERAVRQNVVIRTAANAEEAAQILAFEERVFPFWAEFFEMTAADGRYDDILAVWDGRTVIGSLLMGKANVAALNPDALWHQILGDNLGNTGAVGIDDARQGSGFGLAMVATASEILKARGVRQCIIGWTDLIEFYGKLGYTEWRAYAMTED